MAIGLTFVGDDGLPIDLGHRSTGNPRYEARWRPKIASEALAGTISFVTQGFEPGSFARK